jgi:hypothetical protein
MALIGETNAHDSDGIKRRRYNQNDPKDHGYPAFHHFVTYLLYQQHSGTFTEQGFNFLCNVDFGVILNAHSSNIRLNAEINLNSHEIMN